MAYVYRHIRLDKNVPFYIGIGNDHRCSRANTRLGRNAYWNNIVSKTEFEVEILMDSVEWDEACKKEIEFISLYKRTKDGGTLCNLTLGGEGKLGVSPRNAYLKGSTPYSKGKPMPDHVRKSIVLANTGRPSWNKGIKQSEETLKKQMRTKAERGTILKGDKHPMFGKKQSKEWVEKSRLSRLGISPWNKGRKNNEIEKQKSKDARAKDMIAVDQYSINGHFINTFQSIADASKATGVGKGNIY